MVRVADNEVLLRQGSLMAKRSTATATRMRAAVHTRYGPPEVVQVTEIDTPSPAADELLVRVHATTVNRTDCGYRTPTPAFARLLFGLTRPRTTVLGNEFAGEVVAAGGEVTAFVVGDRIFGYVEGSFGGHAEYLTVASDGLIAAMPPGLTFAQMAPATEGAHYALSAIRRARTTAGDTVCVYGATGAIGSAAVQLLKILGATVTAVCATPHLELVEGLGADRVIDYTVEDFTAAGQVHDLVIDAVGKSSFGRCRRLLKPGGVYVSSELGPFGQNPLLALVTPALGGRTVRFPFPIEDRQMIRWLGEQIGAGRFTPIIDRRYPLDEIVAAYEYVETGRKVGNVVITVTDQADRAA
jgi:NADPH:quinone reductase-like Zn-dependent oxidoreductase